MQKTHYIDVDVNHINGKYIRVNSVANTLYNVCVMLLTLSRLFVANLHIYSSKYAFVELNSGEKQDDNEISHKLSIVYRKNKLKSYTVSGVEIAITNCKQCLTKRNIYIKIYLH